MRRPIIDSIGIEIEYENIPKHDGRDIANKVRWALVEDGSCRSFRHAIGPITITPSEAVRPFMRDSARGSTSDRGGRTTFGGEFVSPVLDSTSKDWIDSVQRILDFLYERGEGISPYTSIHVHVNATNIPLFALQYLIEIGQHLEAGLFRLSCAEAKKHRGEVHCDYAYCRPLGKLGPPVVSTDRGSLPIFETGCLLQAETFNEFKKALGRYDLWDGGSKYHEARYVWLGLASLFLHGSIEFRLFNSTLRSRYIEAWVDLAKNIVRASFGKRTELPHNPLGTDNIDLQDIIEFLMITDAKIIYLLEELWNLGGFPASVHGYQQGHLGQGINWEGVSSRLVPSQLDPEFEVYGFDEFKASGLALIPGYIKFGG